MGTLAPARMDHLLYLSEEVPAGSAARVWVD
jgi:hypothetical protein